MRTNITVLVTVITLFTAVSVYAVGNPGGHKSHLSRGRSALRSLSGNLNFAKSVIQVDGFNKPKARMFGVDRQVVLASLG